MLFLGVPAVELSHSSRSSTLLSLIRIYKTNYIIDVSLYQTI